MYAPERQQEILRLARDGGRVDVISLAEEFQVTAETIRRDLKALDRAGLVRRVHGGAIPAGRLDFEPDLAERESTAADEKDRIAKAALAELPIQGTVILDAGTTVARLAGIIPLEAELTVVTHSLPIAARLADHPGMQLHLVGGACGTVRAPPSTRGRCGRTARSARTSCSSRPTASPPGTG